MNKYPYYSCEISEITRINVTVVVVSRNRISILLDNKLLLIT